MTIEDIKKKYNITTGEVDEIKQFLKNKIKENHPDNGLNNNIDVFTDLIEELEYVENMLKKQEIIVPTHELVKTITGIVQAQMLEEQNTTEKLNIVLSENIKKQITISRDNRKVYRISTAGISAIITFLWMFPNQLLEHPLLEQFIWGEREKANFVRNLTVIWLYILILAAIFWWKSYVNEKKEKYFLEKIKLESVQNEIFTCFLHNLNPKCIFSKDQFVDFLIVNLKEILIRKEKSRYVSKIKLSDEIIQNVADIILSRAKDVGVIRNVKSNSLIESYELVNYTTM